MAAAVAVRGKEHPVGGGHEAFCFRAVHPLLQGRDFDAGADALQMTCDDLHLGLAHVLVVAAREAVQVGDLEQIIIDESDAGETGARQHFGQDGTDAPCPCQDDALVGGHAAQRVHSKGQLGPCQHLARHGTGLESFAGDGLQGGLRLDASRGTDGGTLLHMPETGRAGGGPEHDAGVVDALVHLLGEAAAEGTLVLVIHPGKVPPGRKGMGVHIYDAVHVGAGLHLGQYRGDEGTRGADMEARGGFDISLTRQLGLHHHQDNLACRALFAPRQQQGKVLFAGVAQQRVVQVAEQALGKADLGDGPGRAVRVRCGRIRHSGGYCSGCGLGPVLAGRRGTGGSHISGCASSVGECRGRKIGGDDVLHEVSSISRWKQGLR